MNNVLMICRNQTDWRARNIVFVVQTVIPMFDYDCQLGLNQLSHITW